MAAPVPTATYYAGRHPNQYDAGHSSQYAAGQLSQATAALEAEVSRLKSLRESDNATIEGLKAQLAARPTAKEHKDAGESLKKAAAALEAAAAENQSLKAQLPAHPADAETSKGAQSDPAAAADSAVSRLLSTPSVASADCGKDAVPMVLISDPGQDLDDEMSFILLRYLRECGLCKPLCVCCTLEPAADRARLARGTFDLLGLHEVPVGIGSDGGDEKRTHTSAAFATSTPYMPASTRELHPAQWLLYKTFRDAAPKSLVVLVIASMKDPALFVRDHAELFAQKAKEVVIMGGTLPHTEEAARAAAVAARAAAEKAGKDTAALPTPDQAAQETRDRAGALAPDTANNNTFDMAAAEFFYARCQELAVPLIVVSRFAAYAAKTPRDVYDHLALCGSPIGWRLRNAQRKSIEELWHKAAQSPPLNLPPRCNRAWFLNTFCGGQQDAERGPDDPIWDLVQGFMQYDAVAMLAAIPSLRGELFTPQEVKHGKTGVTNLIIGLSDSQHGVADPPRLLEVLQQGFETGITLNQQSNHSAVAVVLQLRLSRAASAGASTEDHSDIRLCCLMLRALWDFANIECLGLVVTLYFGGEGGSERRRSLSEASRDLRCSLSEADVLSKEPGLAEELPELVEITHTLRAVGLSHVPVRIGQLAHAEAADELRSVSTVSEILREIYEAAPPIGLTLVLSSSVTGAADFAQEHTLLFREKTTRLVHVGGAELIPEDQRADPNQALAPDPEAANNKQDLQSAERLYEFAQRHSVPMVILSRHLQRECSLPRQLFDALGETGELGALLANEQRRSISGLWQKVVAPDGDPARQGLPTRCDRKWFEASFCAGGKVADEADVWPSIVSLNVYSPLALMCALPDYIDQHFNCFSIRLRAATHLVVGLTKDEADVVVDQLALRRFLCEAFVNATLSNQSTFRQPIPSMKDLLAHQTDAASLPEGRIGWVLKSRRANLAALEAFAAATPRRNAAAEKAAAERMAAVAEASVAK